MAAAVDQKTKLIIICNPDNPTGTYCNRQELLQLLTTVADRVIVAIDEAYFEYVVAEDYPQTLQMMSDYPNLFVLRTFSKIHSLAGLRIGFGVGHPDLVSQLQRTREPFNVNSLSQAAGLACLEHWDAVAGRVQRNREQLEWMERKLISLGFVVTPSQTNFLFVHTPGNAGQLTQALLKKGVIVRPMAPWGFGDSAMRISIGLPDENQRCVKALEEILTHEGSRPSP
jgi:histidinol-phosphate aminotransferase